MLFITHRGKSLLPQTSVVDVTPSQKIGTVISWKTTKEPKQTSDFASEKKQRIVIFLFDRVFSLTGVYGVTKTTPGT